MAYDRYDRERRWRNEDDRNPRGWHRDESGFGGRDERDFRGSRDDYGREQGERGFFERMGDEVRSWFGDEDRDDRYGRDEDRDFRGGFREHGRDQARRSQFPDQDRDRGYRPLAGDYGRSGNDRREEFRQERTGSHWDRDPYRRTSFAGSRERSNHDDLHYAEWRRRQVDDLDRDYDDYRRERQSHFEDDFGNWRNRRQSKREMLRNIREHMEVVGNDGEHVGTVDRVAGDRIILTRSDPQAGGVHHSLSCSEVDRIEENRVLLDVSASKARERWRDESRGRALFEREDQGSAGPHVLDRSFSGTYR